MLVLTRKTNEKIVIDDDIEIVIVDIGKDTVRIGIEAPKSVKIHRKEVYEEIQRSNLEASKPLSEEKLKSLQSEFLKKIQKPENL
ncbi:MAG: carbon storage regulator CsrA [Candidatus Riflebacteria bacterium]|nr:carbon storage regulator CsrA [Candidatus Riflebacteria bacterium]